VEGRKLRVFGSREMKRLLTSVVDLRMSIATRAREHFIKR
jgi:hypothetical protein